MPIAVRKGGKRVRGSRKTGVGETGADRGAKLEGRWEGRAKWKKEIVGSGSGDDQKSAHLSEKNAFHKVKKSQETQSEEKKNVQIMVR